MKGVAGLPTRSPQAADVIVVGAGMAGLTVAYRLQQQGRRVVVLEAQGRVGGRMTSDLLGGHVVDRGAQFLSSQYPIIRALVDEMGMTDRLRPTSRRSAIVRDGRPRVLRMDHPLDAWSSGLLSLAGFLKFGWRRLSARRGMRHLSLGDFSEWAAHDDESTRSWSEREGNIEVCDYFLEPMLQGFYFQAPEDTSKALALALTEFGVRKSLTTTLDGGLGRLPEALAQGIDVRLGTPVRHMEITSRGTRIEVSAGTLEARHVIVAVPAPAATRLLASAQLPPAARELLATPYSASINVSILADARFQLPEVLRDAYGLLIPARERRAIAAVGIEGNKGRDTGTPGQLLNLMFCHSSATRLMGSPDHQVLAEAIRSVEPLIPSLSRHIVQHQVIRWPWAEPVSWVGRAKAIRRYREQTAHRPADIVLAGDYMSMPFIEGAAESGDWAARVTARA